MKIGHLVTTLLKTNEQAVVVLLNQVIHTMLRYPCLNRFVLILRKIFKANGLKEPLRILKEFVDLLSAEHKKELEDMLKHLPACVLGNEEGILHHFDVIALLCRKRATSRVYKYL